MLGLTLRSEFQGRKLTGTAIELSNESGSGATQQSAQDFLDIIPTVIDQNPCAHLRMPRDMIFHGWSMRLFQAWQHSATMSS